MAGLAICVPHTRPLAAELVDSLMWCQMPQPTAWMRVSDRPVDEARNLLVEKFLEGNASHLLFLDSDCIFAPEAVLRLLSRNKPIVAAMMYRRALPPTPTAGTYVGKNGKGQTVFRFGTVLSELLFHIRERHGLDINDFKSNAVVLPQTDFDLLKVDGTGMHMTMIHREVFERIPSPWFVMNPNATGEDFYFCLQASEANIPIYADMSVHTGHAVGDDVDFGIKELLSYCKHVYQVQSDSSRFDIESSMEDLTLQVGRWVDGG